MSAALIVAVLMAGGGGDGQTPGGEALAAALTQALGPGTSVVLEYVSTPSEAAALRLEGMAHAAAVATVSEGVPGRPGASSGAGRSVRLRIHLRGGAWRSLQLTFPSGEDAIERGRSIGLAVAATILSNARSPVAASRGDVASPASPASPAESASSASSASPAFAAGSSSNSTTRVAVPSASPSLAEESSPGSFAGPAISTARAPVEASGDEVDALSPAPARHALEILGLGSAGVAGPASGLGVAAHLERAGRTAARAFWARVGGGLRSGSVAGLNGDHQVAWATLGGAWRLPARPASAPAPAPASGHFGIALTVDGGVLVQVLSHRQSTGVAARSTRALPEAGLGLAATWRLRGSWEAQAGLGLEVAIGHTEVWVAQRYVTTIPIVRGLASFGLRFDL
jgi:hypothetical protein